MLSEEPEETSRRKSVLTSLTEKGFEVGSAGYNGSTQSRSQWPEDRRERAAGRNDGKESSDSDGSQTRAHALQQQAEERHVSLLTHDERFAVACRLLATGTWETTWLWFQQQYGPDFKPDVTYDYLSGIVTRYPDDYSHVVVSPRP